MYKFEVWLADLNPKIGTKPGKTRPVVVVQTDMLNEAGHPSTIICPFTTNVKPGAEILRIHVNKGIAGITESSDIMLDQIRAIDNRRLIRKIGFLPKPGQQILQNNLRILLDL
ncbi:MAG: type II toxin-antitoxin system PemK/MazF family toxin [Saprospiraceae bacterium]|nr:type II toxin-antitoxin system PemK/MazF family toxin [Saprospiraceae bacterium]